ncbi:alpha-L-fucosidase [Pedobacter punctiformis]|uniref:alpha-L-fucosidase n=1 Tax=Pedobacter punctiformis TaxID=3004097 RepID=A0ABT4LCA9_9SPHI|nr:alpha-L-fucosidase [Pedobacter sp. HCMS5-2]MCZ4245563.1 alpha-L-fucosidase [Pedobacter sp. HCMS5-2]
MHLKKIVTCLLLLAITGNIYGQTAKPIEPNRKMEWFGDAKLGIFIHWGVYAVNGISESWSFFNNYTNHEAYMKQLEGFNASKYDPANWVQLIKESGAKYAVITTKHHDGVSLWNTKAIDATTTLKNSAAKKDLITPFVAALKQSGLKTGLYFSLPDWSYENYDVFTRDRKRYDFKADPKRWNSFLTYYQSQLNELSAQFKPDLLWFDGNWEHSATEWQTDKVRKLLSSYNPNIIINSRLDEHGDYETPEQGVPVVKPNAPYWELCYTMNDSWGFQPYDQKYKSSNMIIRTLVDCISMGGNLLLDIGPKADGTIATEQVSILKDLGRWTKKNAEAIYGTQSGLEPGHFNGKTALSKDKKTLFLYLDYQDKAGITLLGLATKIKSVSVIGYEGKINFKAADNQNYIIEVPENAYDKDVTVVAVKFDEAIKTVNPVGATLNLATLLNAQTKSSTVSKLKKLSTDLNKGTNIFNNTNLSADGLSFTSDVKPLDTEAKEWIVKNAEVLYKTTAGIPAGHYDGNTTLSADKQTLYLFVEGKPTGPIAIKGLKNQISRIRIVGEGTMLPHEVYNKLYWSKIPGIIYIPVPQDKLDKNLTVIAVLLDGPIDLYREKVGAIESNL